MRKKQNEKKYFIDWLIVLHHFSGCYENKGNSDNDEKLLSTYSEGASDGYSWRMRENWYDENDLVLSKQKLLSTLWGSGQHFYLVFFSDDVFKLGSAQHGVYVTGKYKVDGSAVVLFDYNFDSYINDTVLKLGNETLTGTFVTDSNDFLYKHELQFGDCSFFALGCIKKAGDKSVLDGENVILENGKPYFLTDSVTFRKNPAEQAEAQFNDFYYEQYNLETNSFFKYDTIYVMARTEKEYTYDGITAPWLYIKTEIDSGTVFGWIFGGCIEEFSEEKADEYSSLFHKLIGDAGGSLNGFPAEK